VDPASWQRAKPIIEKALTLSDSDRRAFVNAACDDNEGLRVEIQALLDSYDEDTTSRTQNLELRIENSDVRTETGMHEPATPVTFEFSAGMEVGSRYVLLEPLGRGGGGEVHRANDVRLQREVAIKIAPKRNDDDGGVRRIREARAAAQLNHRGIATIHDVFDIDGRLAIVMELVPGPTLADRMRGGKMPIDVVVNLGVEIADAVEHAHVFGILHCDLKPANIKFAADGAVKVLDFGLARRTENSALAVRGVTGLTGSSLEGLALGTPGYMSPEQLLGLPIDFRSDVYSLGVIVYEMATGERLFDTGTAMSAAVAVLTSPAVTMPRDIPKRLRDVVCRALHKKPEDRFPSAAEFRDALAAARALSWRDKLVSAFRR